MSDAHEATLISIYCLYLAISYWLIESAHVQGRSIRYLVPDGVIEYIKKHQVYD